MPPESLQDEACRLGRGPGGGGEGPCGSSGRAESEAKFFDETQQILQFSMLIVQNTGCNSAVRSRVNDFMLIVQACV